VERDQNLDFDWNWGFRVGAGVDLACKTGWTSEIDWTRYHNHTTTTDGPNSAKWTLHFDTIDGIFGRNFWVGHCFNLKPFAGLRFARITQKVNTDLETAVGTAVVATTNHDSQKFWGLGPQLGLEADWYLAKGFSLYGNLDAAILYGHTKTRFEDVSASTTAADSCDARGSSSAYPLVFDVGFGLRWEFKYLLVHAGLEHHHYENYNRIGGYGDLNLYGLNFGAALRF